MTYSCIQEGYLGQGNISDNPQFTFGPQGYYYLCQTASGQSVQSPCVDAGDPLSPLLQGTTRTDEYPDLGTIDMGFHYQLPLTLIADFYTNINNGEFPFTVNFIDNSYVYLTSVLQYEWDFENDGLIDSYEENPTWTYPDIGDYSVKLIITSQDTDEILTDTLFKGELYSCLLFRNQALIRILLHGLISLDSSFYRYILGDQIRLFQTGNGILITMAS